MRDELVTVGIAEAMTAAPPKALVTYALGSCVGVCLFDVVGKIAGMAHILLPGRAAATEQKNPYKFADSGILCLVAEMEKKGAKRGRITAKIAGGARMFRTNGTAEGIGEKNIKAVRAALEGLGIRIVAEDVGADYGRTIYFHAETGMLRVKSVNQKEKWI